MVNIAPDIPGLRDLSNSPKQLFYRGRWDKALFAKCVAVVGTRRITQYGRMVVEKMIPRLVQDGCTIISGFMYGVDQAAHRQCLMCGGKTIAILGWGINWKGFDQEDASLLHNIEKNGLVISEWEDQKPTLWTFPMRNRIVAAISQELFIVEVAIKSGALITARWAQKLQRPIWAVPGPVTSSVSEGANELIATGIARMWLPQKEVHASSVPSNNPIVQLLQDQAMDASGISRALKQPVDAVGAQLSLLVLSGDIIEREGMFYAG